MQSLFKLFAVNFLFSATSCHAQRMVQTVNDAKKLEINKEQFIGKPLKEILYQIKPKIKSVVGNPDNTNKEVDTYFVFHFVSKEDFLLRSKNRENPISIKVLFIKDVPHKTLPKGGIKDWTNEETNEYRDMIVKDVQVFGID